MVVNEEPKDVQRSLKPLDGIRALCNASILMAHVIFALGIPPHHHQLHASTVAHPLLRTCFAGSYPAMDTFLLLTGLLSAYQLIPALQHSTKPPLHVPLRYIKRRVLRLAPGYYAAILLTLAVVKCDSSAGSFLLFRPPTFPTEYFSPRKILLSMLFLNNTKWAEGGIMTVAWNLAVQMQFCLALPFMLLALRPKEAGFKGRVVALAVAMLGTSLAWRSQQTTLWDIRPPLVFHIQPGQPGFDHAVNFFLSIYMSTLSRLSQLSIGLLLGLLALSPSAISWVRKQWVAATLAAALAMGLVVVGLLMPLEVEARPDATAPPEEAQFVFVWFMGLLYPTAIAMLLVFAMCGPGPVGGLVSWVMGHGVWKWAAKQSYSVYLLHVIATYVTFKATSVLVAPPTTLFFAQVGPWQGAYQFGVLSVLWVAVFILSSAASLLLDAILERFVGKRSSG